MSKKFDFEVKVKTKFGENTLMELPDILLQKGFMNIGFVIDLNVYENVDEIVKVIKICKEKIDRCIVHFYNGKREPTYDYLETNRNVFSSDGCSLVDCIVGIGGGSAMDISKGFAILSKNYKPAKHYKGFPIELDAEPVPVILIPTTVGTGAEVVFNASFIDSDINVKMGINYYKNYPILTILDPVLVYEMPISVAISSGCDALVHTLESYVNKKATTISKIFGKEAFRLIINALPKLLCDKKDKKHWQDLLLGSHLAMMSLSNSSSGPAHVLGGYHLCTNYNVPHGFGGGIFLPKMTRLNHDLGYHGYHELYDTIDECDVDIIDHEKRSEFVVMTIEKIFKSLGIPKTIRTYGANSKKDYDIFYKYATQSMKHIFANNPIEIPNDIISKMLKSMIME
jgi:alcohol dehydrogenase